MALKPKGPEDERSIPPFQDRLQRAGNQIATFDLRERWWRLLDFFEARKRLRRLLLVGAILAISLGAAGYWGYRTWTERNSLKIARGWIAAGRLNYAAESAQKALERYPENPEAWLLAAEVARLSSQRAKAIDYARRAAELAPENPDAVLGWAVEALRADDLKAAEKALATLPAEASANSAYAQRVLGELARRQEKFSQAQLHFETALRLGGTEAANEVPLGLVLVNSTNGDVRTRGLGLLAKWTSDHEWGAAALRALLSDATNANDIGAMRRWSEALRTHPGCTIADMPNVLRALSRTDAAHYREVLAELEKNHAVTPQAAAQLIGWLNEIGRSVDAVAWFQTLPQPAMQRPPLSVLAAEALRATGDWHGLENWVKNADWGRGTEFVRWAYALEAAHQLGDINREGEYQNTLEGYTGLNAAQALFIGSTLYSWGRVPVAVSLWWTAAGQGGEAAVQALGTLARHYQTHGDADGLYRTFRQLHSLRAQDAAVANNYVFYAALTLHDEFSLEQIARENLQREPRNAAYAATLAFTLTMRQRNTEALAVLEPFAPQTASSPALAFARGLTLARMGRKPEAAPLLRSLPPTSLTKREAALVAAALAD